MKKPSFLSRLTGTTDDFEYADSEQDHRPSSHSSGRSAPAAQEQEWSDGPEELAVDVYQTPDAIVIKTLISGIHPGTVDISLTREMVTISGIRHDEKETEEENYFQRELFWGSFSRTILLPEEVDVDLAEASERHGILQIRLPKINKKREAKLKVRSR